MKDTLFRDRVHGEDAIAKYRDCRDKIELLILDVIMPRKSGKEACEAIRVLNPDIKTLFMSGYTAEVVSKKGLLDNSVHFISKPGLPQGSAAEG